MQKIYDLGLNRQVEVKQLNLAKPKTDKPEANNNEAEVRDLLEASLMLLPTHRQAAKILLKEALNKLG